MPTDKFEFTPEQLAQMLSPEQFAALERSPQTLEDLKTIYRTVVAPMFPVISAISAVWQSLDERYPEGAPGSYEQARHETAIAVLRELRSHLAAQLRKLPGGSAPEERERYLKDLESTLARIIKSAGVRSADEAIDRIGRMHEALEALKAILALKPLPSATKEDLSIVIGEIRMHARHGLGGDSK